MNAAKSKPRADEQTSDIDVWESEGGSQAVILDSRYGRRVEPDGSWTIYHVFTGVPASMGSQPMTGLGKLDATATMMSLNAHNPRTRQAARWRQAFAIQLPLVGGGRS